MGDFAKRVLVKCIRKKTYVCKGKRKRPPSRSYVKMVWPRFEYRKYTNFTFGIRLGAVVNAVINDRLNSWDMMTNIRDSCIKLKEWLHIIDKLKDGGIIKPQDMKLIEWKVDKRKRPSHGKKKRKEKRSKERKEKRNKERKVKVVTRYVKFSVYEIYFSIYL